MIILFFKYIIALFYTGIMFYILEGGQVYLAPLCVT